MKKIIALAAFLMAAPVYAQEPQCAPRDHFVKGVVSEGGVPVGMGLNVQGNILEIWVNPIDEWIAVITTPENISCIVTWGRYWGPN